MKKISSFVTDKTCFRNMKAHFPVLEGHLLVHMKLFISSSVAMNGVGCWHFGEQGKYNTFIVQTTRLPGGLGISGIALQILTLRWHNLNKNKNVGIFHVSATITSMSPVLFIPFPCFSPSLFLEVYVSRLQAACQCTNNGSRRL